MFSAWGLLVALLAASVQVDGNKIPLNYKINSTIRDTLN